MEQDAMMKSIKELSNITNNSSDCIERSETHHFQDFNSGKWRMLIYFLKIGHRTFTFSTGFRSYCGAGGPKAYRASLNHEISS